MNVWRRRINLDSFGLKEEAIYDILNEIEEITMLHHYLTATNTRPNCDASKLGLGASFEQGFEQNVWKPIDFASRQLNSQEAKYSTSELESLIVVWSMYHLRYYL